VKSRTVLHVRRQTRRADDEIIMWQSQLLNFDRTEVKATAHLVDWY